MRRGWGGVQRFHKFGAKRVFFCPKCESQREAESLKKALNPEEVKKCPYCGDPEPIAFASKKEAHRYRELLLMQKARLISDIELQPKFVLPAGIKYVADFAYTDCETGERKYEDSKGFLTKEFKLKMRLMKEAYPEITIILT